MKPLLIAALCVLLVCPSQMAEEQTTTPTTPDQKAQATGKTIGTIVSSAFDTAFPIIGKIMDLFKKPTATPPPADTKKKPPATPDPTAVTQNQVQDAVTKAQTDLKKTFKEQLQPTASIAKELWVVQTFATGGAKASENLASINRYLSMPKPDYSKIDTEWKKLNKQLAPAMTTKKTDIQVIREVSIQARFLDLQDANNDLMVDITDNIQRGLDSKPDFSKVEFQSQISAMGSILKGFDSLAAAELGVLQSDLDSLAAWANSQQGKEDKNIKPADPQLVQIATNAVAKAKALSRKK